MSTTNLTHEQRTEFEKAEDQRLLAPAHGSPIAWQSWAQWPAGLVRNVSGEGENCTVDRHYTKEQAQGVCDLLHANGFGGEHRHFPVRTWVVPVYAGNNQPEPHP